MHYTYLPMGTAHWPGHVTVGLFTIPYGPKAIHALGSISSYEEMKSVTMTPSTSIHALRHSHASHATP